MITPYSCTEVVGSPFNEEVYGIAVNQGSPLREQINRALLQLREDGTYDVIYAKWFGE
jgi:polar amino acid transport system substrate-binding protein